MELAPRLVNSDLANSTSPHEDHIKEKVTQEGEKLLGPLHWWPPKSNLQEPNVPRKHERLLALDLLPHTHSISFRHLNKPATDIRLGLNLDAKRFVRMPPFTWSILIQHLLEYRVWAFHGHPRRDSVSEPHVGTAMWANWHGAVQKETIGNNEAFPSIASLDTLSFIERFTVGLKKLQAALNVFLVHRNLHNAMFLATVQLTRHILI